jgi:ParB/RepB/Spo0J family partition protein
MSKKQKAGLGKAKSSPKKLAKSTTDSEVVADAQDTALDVQRVRVDDIVVIQKNFRALCQDTVNALKESMCELGLIHPLTGCFEKSQDDSEPTKMILTSGQHRLAAAKELDWKYIDVVVVGRNKRKNVMRRISENLHRNSLSKIEEGEEILKWLEHRYAGDGQVAQHNDKGITAAAKQFGKSRRSVRRLIEAAAISPDAALALKEAKLDKNGTVLKAVLGEALDDQLDKVEEIIRERNKTSKNGKQKRKSEPGKKPHRAVAAKQTSEAIRSSADGDGWDDDAVASDEEVDATVSTQEALQHAWDVSGAFRKAWAAADVDERQRFFDDVLLGYEVTISEDTDSEDVEEDA